MSNKRDRCAYWCSLYVASFARSMTMWPVVLVGSVVSLIRSVQPLSGTNKKKESHLYLVRGGLYE